MSLVIVLLANCSNAYKVHTGFGGEKALSTESVVCTRYKTCPGDHNCTLAEYRQPGTTVSDQTTIGADDLEVDLLDRQPMKLT